MTAIAEVFRKGHPLDKKVFWENELKSLGIEPKREMTSMRERSLGALAEIIKQAYYQDYKTAYGDVNDNNDVIKQPFSEKV